MQNKRMIVGVCLLVLLGVLAVDYSFAQKITQEIPGLTAKGKKAMEEIPDLTMGGQKNDKHDWNLGPTGARGWMWGMRLRTDYARQVLITKVDAGSPADGILEVGDVIQGVGGKQFDSDARIAFGRAVTEAEKQKNRGRLKLIRWRNGRTENVTLKLKVMGTYGPTAPMNCRKSQRILNDACRYIEKNGIGKGITGHVNALGLLASGQEKYLPMVRDYAHKIRVEDAYTMSSWNMSYMNIFLSEYYLLTGDKTVLPKIKHMALYLANGQSRVGTWGHGNAINGLLQGYGAMCQPSLSCVVSLQLNQKCGIDDTVVEKAIRKSEIFFQSFVNKGNIPYGDHSPRQVHDSNGRSSLAVIFYDLLDNPEAYSFFARMTVASYGEREEGHTGNYWSFLWGPLGAMRAGPEAAAAFIKELEWFFELERRWDGGFTYQGGANMSGSEHTTPGWDTTGARILMYAMSLQKLQITGKGLKLEKALTGKELEDTMLAGRDYSTWVREGFVNVDSFDACSSDELLKRLNTWSTPMRIRAGKALAKKKGDFIGPLKKMLSSNDREIILGGIYGLEYQGTKGESSIDGLVTLLTHDDEWIRFRAGCALCAIGKPAVTRAVPVMLKMAVKELPNDPREMNQRYIAFVLWGDGNNGSPRGLLQRSMTGVDNDLLVPAIKKLIRNEDGLARSFVSRAIRMMSFEELAPLWPDVIYGLKEPAPSGIMFNADIRETCMNVLVKYRFKEAVPYVAEYVRTMKQHGSQERIYRVMDTLKSYGALAKPALPKLYEAREYYKKNLGPGKPLEFPTWALDKFMKGLNEGIKAIEEATETPNALRSIADYIVVKTEPGVIKTHYRGLHGYIGYSAAKPSDRDRYSYGMGFYSAVWPLIDKPLAMFQIGLAGSWITPKNADNKDKPLAPIGTHARDNWPKRGPTYGSVFQTLEGGLGYWRGNRFRYGPPKFSMNATPQCYDYEVGSPGWSFFYDTEALPDDRLGIAQLSNTLLIPPDALPFQGNPNGKFLGYSYVALPFTKPTNEKWATGEQSWTCFLSASNFKGPIAYYIPETWSKIAKLFNYPFIIGRGLDAQPANMGGGAMEINTVPCFESFDKKGVKYAKIPQLQFPVDDKGRTLLVQDVVYYSKDAIYNSFKAWRDGSPACSGKFDEKGAWKSKLTTHSTRYDQAGKEMTGINTIFDTKIHEKNVWGLEWFDGTRNKFGKFPQYYRHEGECLIAIPPSEVPKETKLLKKEFKLAKPGKPFTSPAKGAWTNPGAVAGPFKVKLTDGSLVTYSWYRFVDQPSFQQYKFSKAKKDELQAFVEKIHREWPIDRDYMAPPTMGELATLDPALLVTPPKGMEVGYVPIVTRQEAAND